MLTHDKLWNVDSKGKVRIWYMQTDGGKHRTVSGLFDGKQVTSGWVIVKAKNVGRSNATTVEEQALAEVASDYTKKLEGKYYTSLEEAKAAGSGTKFFSPMTAVKWVEVKSKYDWTKEVTSSQPKLDGMRCSASHVDGCLSRGGKDIPVVLFVLESLAASFSAFEGLRLDGELYNHSLADDFDTMISLCKQPKAAPEDIVRAAEMVQYHVYDCPSHPGTFLERYAFLKDKVFPHITDKRIVLVETKQVSSEEELDMVYSEYLEAGYEGQMIRKNDHYVSKRSKGLIKRKEFFDAEYEVIAVEEGLGNWAGAVKRAVLKLPDGRKFESGVRGTKEANAELFKRAGLGDVPKLATVRYPNLTPSGIPRFGQVTEWFGVEGRKH